MNLKTFKQQLMMLGYRPIKWDNTKLAFQLGDNASLGIKQVLLYKTTTIHYKLVIRWINNRASITSNYYGTLSQLYPWIVGE